MDEYVFQEMPDGYPFFIEYPSCYGLRRSSDDEGDYGECYFCDFPATCWRGTKWDIIYGDAQE